MVKLPYIGKSMTAIPAKAQETPARELSTPKTHTGDCHHG